MANLTMKVLQEQINELRNEVAILKTTSKANKIPYGLKVGDTFELVGLTWTILDITEDGYKCIAERFEDGMVFDDDSNDWRTSNLRVYLNKDFCERIASEIGENNIISFERDLLSLDGQTEYGSCEDKVSLLTVDEYRKYRKLIPNADYWWWLITPWSTPCNDYKTSVTVVSPSGGICSSYCFNGRGVRPVCIFSSSIFESED
nr:MAG TPA: hypothetical protein [Caudoviricetes sp.]